MKKLLLAASGFFLAASLYMGVNSYKNINSGTDLLLVNVAALAQGGEATPQFPCLPNGEACEFRAMDAAGDTFNARVPGYRNATSDEIH
ncbi:MAG: hypothetical protein PHS48_05365 [Bacteroidales bacterium]|nr:hypothetical protein [Bacteroidales bacterium]